MASIAVSFGKDPREQAPVHVATGAWTIDKLACWLLVVAVVFINAADFRGDTGEEFRVHWQIYLRLLVAFICGCVGILYFIPKTFRDFLAGPGLFVSGYVAWYGATLVTSVDRSYCTAAWISLVGVLLIIPAAMRVLGGANYLSAVASGLTLYLIGSWIAYLFVPAVGVFQEQVTQTLVYERMGGLGHPNELGFYAAFTVLVYAGLATSGRLRWSIASCGMALGAATLLTCFSRTAMIACGFGLLFTLQMHLRQRGNAVAVFLALSLLTLVAFIAMGTGKLDWFVESALTKLTKSGSTEELSTATGRTEIWAYGIEQIKASPIVGYGYCSARFVMEEYSFHCHNIVLNALLFGGILSGGIVLGMILYLMRSLVVAPRPEIDGLVVCMLVGGMVDGLLGAPSPAATVLIWFSILLWRQLDMHLAPPASV
ncbi:MAG: O-antigen ligase family protein [Pirellulaceae bacterium]